MSDQNDFNQFVCTKYWSRAELIACRFTDLGCEDWEKLSCEWHVRYQFGRKTDPDDVYFEGNVERRRSVDNLIAKPEVSAQSEIMANAWAFHKAFLKKMRDADPVVITPPAPEPPPPVVKVPKPIPVPEPVKTQKPVWLIKASVYITIATPIILLASSFLPPPWSTVAKVLWEVLKQFVNGG